MVVLFSRTQQSCVTAFHSLDRVYVDNCLALKSLLEWEYDSKVKTLVLWNCKMLFEERMNWALQSLSCLEDLIISGWEDDLFPEEGLLPTTLTTIKIRNCRNLGGLNGKAFQQLTSLTSLHILDCRSLRGLPEEGLPASLSHLSIRECPLLKQRCEKEGEDWPKISHIASVYLDFKLIK